MRHISWDMMRLYSARERFAHLAWAGLGRCPDQLTGHVSLAMTGYIHMCWNALQFGTLQDAEPLGTTFWRLYAPTVTT
jgi:hypothetical protein